MNDLVKSSASTNDFEDNGIKLTPVEGNTSTHEYLYDGNGNMIQDKNKNITVTYNFMNLPTVVDFGNNNKIVWTYSVSGAKLRKTVYTNNSVTLVQDYVSGFVYKNSQLDFFGMEEGRVKKTSNGTLRYEYNLTDHLGNTRVSFADTNNDGAADLLQEDHYYAFGLRIEGLSSQEKDNKFTYNGKELEDDHGLNWYHYGARYYDPALGRWHSVDPLDELLSPYNFTSNNPINIVDPDGTSIDPSEAQKFQEAYNQGVTPDQRVNWLGDWLTDLSSKSGLLLEYDPSSNNLKYQINKEATNFSKTVRADLIKAIDDKKNVISVTFNLVQKSKYTFYEGINTVILNPNQISAFICGSKYLDKTTMGWAISFMHELSHGPFKGLHDYEDITNVNGTVYYENNIRRELGEKRFGQRQSYTAVGDSEYGYLAFNKFAKDNLYGYRLIEQGQFVKGDKKYFTIKKNP